MGNYPGNNNERLDKPEEACGVFGIVSTGNTNVAKTAFYGILAIQHRGQESAGIATYDHDNCYIHKNMGLVSQVFDENILNCLTGKIAVAHNRYSTMGCSTINNAQPLTMESKIGTITLAHNGNLINASSLKEEVSEYYNNLDTTCDSELIIKLIGHYVNIGNNLEAAVKKAIKKCVGSFSLVIGTQDKLIAVRDAYGIRPLCLGKTSSEDLVVASETCSLDTVGAEFIRDIEPAEVLVIDKNKNTNSFKYTDDVKDSLCIFELIYFARPDSQFFGKSVYSYRYKLGEILAQTKPVEADIIVPVPESGNIAALGYSAASGITITNGFIKNRYIGRTFIQPTPEIRELGIKLKLNPIKDIIKGKRLIVIDDSIVRGNTSKKIVEMLKSYGAKEVHMRISSSPITCPCYYGIDVDTKSQLIASNKNVQEITKFIGADSLEYLEVEDMIKACKSGHNYCDACFTGNYPIKEFNHNETQKSILEKTTAQ